MYQPSSLLTRRQQQNCYLQQLELPPLSDLLPTSPPTSVAPEPACTVAPLVAATSTAATTATAAPNPVYYYPPLLVPETNPELIVAPSAVTTTLPLSLHFDPELHHQHHPRTRQPSESSDKVYSFVSIPGTTQKKRPRRRYDEIERLYRCNWPGCTKAYGTLNHLNAHVSMQRHGSKRHPSEFKEMRKEWRRQKKEREASVKKAKEEMMLQFQLEQEEQAATAVALSALSAATVFPTIPYQDPITGFY